MGKEQGTRFFYDSANRRIIECEQFLNNLFGGIFDGGDGDNKGFDLRSTGEVLGEYMRKWEEDIIYLADYKDSEETALRRKDVYSFYFMLAHQHKMHNKDKMTEDFGPQAR